MRTAAAYALVLVLTALFTVWGAVLTMLRLGDVPVPLGLLLAVAVGPLCWLGGSWVPSRYAVAGPAVLWALLVLPLMTVRREGDLIITGSARGVAFLALGALSSVVAIAGWVPRATPGGPDSRSTARGGVAAR